jgi:hypothetical protein
MKKYEGYEQAEAFTGEFDRLKPDGYICKIVDVKAEEKEYGTLLRIAFDIAEGDYKDYFRQLYKKRKETLDEAKWPNGGMYYQTAREDDLRYFKGFMTSIEESNPGYKWNWDEKTLRGKLFGGIFGEEEYEGNDGIIKTAVKCRFIRSVDAIRNGKFSIPPVKTLNKKDITKTSAQNDLGSLLSESADDDIPF